MRKILLMLAAFPMMAFAQTDTLPRNADGYFEYANVVNVDSATADKLYSNSKIFIVESFKSGKDVTQITDDATKTVMGNGSITINFKGINGLAGPNYVNFKMSIQSKNGRYRYSFHNFEYIQITNRGKRSVSFENDNMMHRVMSRGMYRQMVVQVNDKINNLITNLSKNMRSESEATKDW